MKCLWALVFAILVSCKGADTAKILGVLPYCSKSHFAVGASILKALAEKGHEITVISTFPMPKTENITYREIYLKGVNEYFKENVIKDELINSDKKANPFMNAMILKAMALESTEKSMENENIKAFLAEKNTFDLVIVEGFGTESVYGFADHFNAPLIVISTTTTGNWINDLTGNPEPLSYVPNIFIGYSSKMTFFERTMNTLLTCFQTGVLDVYYYRQHEKLLKKYFPNTKKSLTQIMKEDVSLVFLNTHFSLSFPRPYVPNMIEIGGINIDRKIDELPSDIQLFLDSAKDGVILFSMGSFLLPSDFTLEQRKAFINAFAKLKQKVVWRYDLNDAATLPKNILVKKWLPQKEILGHPNVKLFMTHGGMLGTTEGIYYGKPMIGIPVFGDQYMNIARAQMRGFALKLNLKNVTEPDVTNAIREVLENSKYGENARKLSKIYRDQPMTPQETVVYWSEYVINHKGAHHMKVEGVNLGFIEYHNLDVFLVLFITLILFVVIPQIIMCRLILRKVCRKIKPKTKIN